MTKFVIISDTHNKLDKIPVPDGDVLIHAGDATNMGTLEEITKLNEDFGNLPHPVKIFSPGNHDFMFEQNTGLAKSLITNAIVYIHEPAEVAGIKFWFSPYQPWYHDWAFNKRRGEDISRVWDQIADDTQFLITHGPPHGIMDATLRGELVGCKDLLKTIQGRLKSLKYHAFGHIHEAYGHTLVDGVSYINASCVDNRSTHKGKYNAPFIIDL